MNGIALPILCDFQRILTLGHANQPVSGSFGNLFCQFLAIGQQYKVSAHNGRIGTAAPNGEVNGHIMAGNREFTSQPSGNLSDDFFICASFEVLTEPSALGFCTAILKRKRLPVLLEAQAMVSCPLGIGVVKGTAVGFGVDVGLGVAVGAGVDVTFGVGAAVGVGFATVLVAPLWLMGGAGVGSGSRSVRYCV